MTGHATAHLWIEHMRRQLGRPSMTDDAFEALGHQAVVDDRYPPASGTGRSASGGLDVIAPPPAEKGQ